MPDYCSEFKCIADKCRDNCCIGWEIDIDKKSEEYYLSCDGEFGNKLRNNIQKGKPGCFILGEKERCPFLNKKNLCEIIINLGEDTFAVSTQDIMNGITESRKAEQVFAVRKVPG